jgi:hypothetical protein
MNASHHVPGTVPLAGVVPSPQTVETYVAGLPEAAPYRELDARSNIRRGPSAPGPGPGGRAVLEIDNSELVVTWGGPIRAGLVPACILAIHGRV